MAAVAGQGGGRPMTPISAGRYWTRCLTWLLFALAVLVTAVTAAFLGYLINLWVAGHSAGGNPADISALSFPLALLFFLVSQIPALTVATVLWWAYFTARARTGPALGGNAEDGGAMLRRP